MADNNSVLTTVLVVVAVLLFTGNLTGNQVRNAPPGSQIAAWCQSPEGKLIAAGDYYAYAVENNNHIIEYCNTNGDLSRLLCPRVALALGSNKAILNVQDITTNPLNYGCREVRTTGVSNTIQSPSIIN